MLSRARTHQVAGAGAGLCLMHAAAGGDWPPRPNFASVQACTCDPPLARLMRHVVALGCPFGVVSALHKSVAASTTA